MNSEHVSLECLAEAGVSDSAVLTSAGSSFGHCGAKIEKSCDSVVRPLLALSDGARNPAEVVEWSAQAGVCRLTNAWR